MKLNFDYCKTCNAWEKIFYKDKSGTIIFYCDICGEFLFDEIVNLELFQTYRCFTIEKLKIKDFETVNKMNILKYSEQSLYGICFGNCPYRLEHLVE